MNLSIFTALCSQHTKLHCIQCASCISSCNIGKKFHRVIINHCLIASHPFFHIIDGTPDQFRNIFFTKWLQFKNAGSGDQRTVYFKIRVFCCRTNQNNGSIFHKRKQIILLPFIKSVNLIYKKNRFLLVHAKRLFCLCNHCFHIFLSRYSSINLGKLCARCICNHFCKRGLSGPRRSIENN